MGWMVCQIELEANHVYSVRPDPHSYNQLAHSYNQLQLTARTAMQCNANLVPQHPSTTLQY